MSRDQYTDGELIVDVLREIRDELKKIADSVEPRMTSHQYSDNAKLRARRLESYKPTVVITEPGDEDV